MIKQSSLEKFPTIVNSIKGLPKVQSPKRSSLVTSSNSRDYHTLKSYKRNMSKATFSENRSIHNAMTPYQLRSRAILLDDEVRQLFRNDTVDKSINKIETPNYTIGT
jgi:hypothetical protein